MSKVDILPGLVLKCIASYYGKCVPPQGGGAGSSPINSCPFRLLHTDESEAGDADLQTMASCLPSTYMSEPRLRIEFYRKIASIMETREVVTLREELVDRFGHYPEAVEALLLESEIKCFAQQAGFDSWSQMMGLNYYSEKSGKIRGMVSNI